MAGIVWAPLLPDTGNHVRAIRWLLTALKKQPMPGKARSDSCTHRPAHFDCVPSLHLQDRKREGGGAINSHAFKLKPRFLDKAGHGNNRVPMSCIAFPWVGRRHKSDPLRFSFFLIGLFKLLLCRSVQCSYNNVNIINALERCALEGLKYS